MSEIVKRYNLWMVDYDGRERDPLKEEDERGDWVTAEHYAALEVKLGQSESRLHEVAVVCATAEQERDEALSDCERLRADAERYRFLMRELGGSVAQVVMGSPVFSDEDVSAAIDAALSAKT